LACTIAATGAASARGRQAGASDQTADKAAPEIIVTVFSGQGGGKGAHFHQCRYVPELAQQNAASSADLLKNVPGVFVNSRWAKSATWCFRAGFRPIRSMGRGLLLCLAARGRPAGRPDHRQQLWSRLLPALGHQSGPLRAARRHGGDHRAQCAGRDFQLYLQERQDRSRAGRRSQILQGNGKLPQYRADAYAGGQLDRLYYAIGGFLRIDNGTHDAGYALNKGGQVKANLLYEYDGGSLQLTGKYLNDANDWNEFTPALAEPRSRRAFPMSHRTCNRLRAAIAIPK
jgi:hypothetical protein